MYSRMKQTCKRKGMVAEKELMSTTFEHRPHLQVSDLLIQ